MVEGLEDILENGSGAGTADRRVPPPQGEAVAVKCARDVDWINHTQVYSGRGTVWHETWEPVCVDDVPNLGLLSLQGYLVGSYVGDMREYIALDGRGALQEWLGECRRHSDTVTLVPAQVEVEPAHALLCWREGKGVYIGDGEDTATDECVKCRVASITERYPCTDDALTFCDTEDYNYSVFSPKYDKSCSARARREWLTMGEDVASSLHREECGPKSQLDRGLTYSARAG